jgi:formamidopyrimidine-DNA glycosylase
LKTSGTPRKDVAVPELPEVEITRLNLMAWTAGKRVERVDVFDAKALVGDVTRVERARFTNWRRRGKYLIGALSTGGDFVSHLGMTGKWVLDPDAARKHQRLKMRLEDGSAVSFVDTRKFGGCFIAASADGHPRISKLGPDALTEPVAGPFLMAQIGESRGPLKQRLMDQSVVAGLGNIAVVDIAWRAKIHPHMPCRELTPAQWRRVAAATREHIAHVLGAEDGDEIIYLGEKGAQNPFVVYGRAGQPCLRCTVSIERGVLSGRPSFWCPACQPL